MKNVVYCSVCKCMEEGSEMVRLIWAAGLNKSIKSLLGRERAEGSDENVKTLINISSRHGVRVLVDVKKGRLHG